MKQNVNMRVRDRIFLLLPIMLVGQARADIAPSQGAASLAAKEAADEKKRQTCLPRSEEEYGRYGQSVIQRQVEYDLQVGEVTADSAELRRALTSWMNGRAAAVRACLPAPALMQVPERLSATVHLGLLGQRVQSVVVLSTEPPSQQRRIGLDAKCVEQALLGEPALDLKIPIPVTRARIALLYAPFCVISREYDNPNVSSHLSYGRGKNRYLMPANAPAPSPPAGMK